MELKNLKAYLGYLLLNGMIVVCGLLSITQAVANPTQLEDSEKVYSLGFDLYILPDKNSEFTFEEISSGQKDNLFYKSPSVVPNYGFKPYPYWIKIELKNLSQVTEWILEIGFPIISDIFFYVLNENGEVLTKENFGIKYPFQNRKIKNRKFLFPVEIPSQSIRKYIFKINNKAIMNFPIKIYSEKHFVENDHKEYLVLSLYYGIMIAMIFYNLFLFLSIRDVTYIYYSTFLFFSGLYFVSQNGLGYELFWSNSPNFALRINQIAISYLAVFAFLYTYHFLNCREVYPQIKKFFILLGTIAVLSTFHLYFSDLYYQISGRIISITGFISIFTMFLVSIKAYRKGYNPAIYFLISTVALFIGGILYTLRTFGWIESNMITDNAMQFGSMLDTILLSFGLANRINVLKREKQVAEATTKAKSVFFAMMSHEIRTPMNGMIGMAELLEKTKLDSKQKELLHVIKESGNSLLTIINDILDYSKIESGKIEFQKEVFELEVCLQESVELFSIQAESKKIDLYYGLDVNVPKYIIGDKIRLRQILVNLISNAIKFTEEGEVIVYVKKLNVWSDLITLEFSVKDTGIGISSEQKNILFQPFTQLDSSITRRFGGTGLGLAICARLVDLMNGTIWIDPKTTKGTKILFTIVVPPAKEEDFVKKEEINQNQESILELAIKKEIKILIADDSSINQIVLQEMLLSIGFESDVVKNGLEVLSAIEEKQYDIIFMDIQMPQLDGITTTQKIRLLNIENPPFIIAMTANATSQDREDCLNAGMDDYLSKPVELNLLKTKTLYWSLQAVNRRK